MNTNPGQTLTGKEQMDMVQDNLPVWTTTAAIAGLAIGKYLPDTGITLLVRNLVPRDYGYLDLALPTGYTGYELVFVNVVFTTIDDIGFALSPNGGSTFQGTPGVGPGTGYNTSSEQTAEVHQRSMGLFCSANRSPMWVSARIFPGAEDSYPAVYFSWQTFDEAVGYAKVGTTSTVMVETKMRQNFIRIMPYGVGDPKVHSGNLFDTGSYVLRGISS